MVENVEITVKIRVLVSERIKTVRARRNNLTLTFGNPRKHPVKSVDVFQGQLLEQKLVTCTPRRVAGAAFRLAQNRELHTCCVEQLDDGAGSALAIIIKRSRTPHPEQVFDIIEAFRILAEHRHLNAVTAGLGNPRGALRIITPPWVALDLQVFKHSHQFGGEIRLGQHLEAAHVHHVVDVLNVDRALLHAGATVGARPQHIRVDNIGLAHEFEQVNIGICGVGGKRVRVLKVGSIGDGRIPDVGDKQLWRQGFPGIPGGALGLAAAAFRAGCRIKEHLPAGVLEMPNAKGGILLNGVDREFGCAVVKRQDLTQCGGAVGVALEENIEERQEAVPGDTPREIAGHHH